MYHESPVFIQVISNNIDLFMGTERHTSYFGGLPIGFRKHFLVHAKTKEALMDAMDSIAPELPRRVEFTLTW